MWRVLTFIVLVLAGDASQETTSWKAFELRGNAQGTTWQVVYYSQDSIVAKCAIDSIMLVIDSSLSLYKNYSRISQFNRSTKGVLADTHLKKVAMRSQKVSHDTKGNFDITVAPLVQAWGFGPRESSVEPSSSQIKSLLRCVGYKMIHIQGDSLVKEKPCIQIDMNGIAQGYTVDVVADFLKSKGIKNFLVELGGELVAEGSKQPSGDPFRVGIEAPGEDNFTSMQKIVELKSGALTTSGNYRKFRESGGKRLSHIINPRTGRPVLNDIISVTVSAPDAITADAYDNVLLLLGMRGAMQFVEKRAELNAFIIYRDANGVVRDTVSRGFGK